MTRHALFALYLAACASQGVDHDPSVDNQSDGTRTLSPSLLTLERYPGVCGVQNPPFMDTDLYGLNLAGSAVAPANPNMISVTFHRTLPLGQALPVDLNAFGVLASSMDGSGNVTDVVYGQDGTLPLSDNSFTWWRGTDTTEVDDQPLTSASVTFQTMPAADGDDATLTIRMMFTDGGVYDSQINVPLSTSSNVGCPAG